MLRHTRTYGLCSTIQKLLPMVWILPEAQSYDVGEMAIPQKYTMFSVQDHP